MKLNIVPGLVPPLIIVVPDSALSDSDATAQGCAARMPFSRDPKVQPALWWLPAFPAPPESLPPASQAKACDACVMIKVFALGDRVPGVSDPVAARRLALQNLDAATPDTLTIGRHALGGSHDGVPYWPCWECYCAGSGGPPTSHQLHRMYASEDDAEQDADESTGLVRQRMGDTLLTSHFGDRCDSVRLLLPKVVLELVRLLGCRWDELVVVPYAGSMFVAGVCSNPGAMIGLGDLTIIGPEGPRRYQRDLQGQAVSAQPLRLARDPAELLRAQQAQQANLDAAAAPVTEPVVVEWVSYPCWGGFPAPAGAPLSESYGSIGVSASHAGGGEAQLLCGIEEDGRAEGGGRRKSFPVHRSWDQMPAQLKLYVAPPGPGCSLCCGPARGGLKAKLSKCGGTCGGTVAYCSRQCQAADWPRHKAACGKRA